MWLQAILNHKWRVDTSSWCPFRGHAVLKNQISIVALLSKLGLFVRLSRKFLFKGMFELSSQKCLFFYNVDLNQIWNCIFYSRVKLVSRQCKLQRCWQTETAYAAVRCKYQRRIIHLMITCAVPFAQFEHLQETIRHTKMHIYKHAQVFYISTRVHVM